MEQLSEEFGQHYLVEFIDCNPDKINFVKDVEAVLLQAAEVSQATVLEHHFYQFDPVGVTGVIMIAESHFSIHTWPEKKYASFDILTCGEMFPEKAIELIQKEIEAKRAKVQVVTRGY